MKKRKKLMNGIEEKHISVENNAVSQKKEVQNVSFSIGNSSAT